MYDKIEADQYGVEGEAKVLKFWKENDVVKKAMDKNDGTGEEFTFYDGPPTANGKPHAGISSHAQGPCKILARCVQER